MMELSMSSCYYDDRSPEEAVERLAKNGWIYMELSSEHGANLLRRGDPESVGRKFRHFAENAGLFIPQGHLWLNCDIAVPDQEEVVEQLKKWIDLFWRIGIRHAVLHPNSRPLYIIY